MAFTDKGRALLERLEELIGRCGETGGVIVAVLPTGYGKTSFVRERLLPKVAGGLRVVHVLPLRAIVEEATSKAAERAESQGLPLDIVGYQAGVVVGGVDKSPYLARDYMIVTVDSFLLSFYGIPVYELLRSNWHSDVAYMLSRSFNLLLLDEFHLMVAGDAEQDRGEGDILAKQVVAVAEAVADFVKRGRCVALLTATLPPSILRAVLELASRRLGGNLKLWLLAYGSSSHDYIKALVNAIKGLDGVSLGEEDLITEVDDTFNEDRCGGIKTLLMDVDKEAYRVDGVDVNILSLEGVFDKVLEELKKGGCTIRGGSEGLRVFLSFNSWRRAYASYVKYRDAVRRKFGCSDVVLLNGKMSMEDRAEKTEKINRKGVCLFATQAVEAGVDADFDVLITEAAPAPALVQRAGRVARHRKPGSCNLVAIVYYRENPRWTAQGIYDEEAVEETLKALKGHSVVDWRCPQAGGGLDAWKLILRVDKVIGAKVSKALGGAEEVLNEIKRILLLTRPPLETLRLLDEKFDGSFIRSSSLIPIIPWEALKEVNINDPGRLCSGTPISVGSEDIERLVEKAIAVDTGFLARYGKDLLHKCGGKSSGEVVAVIRSGGEVSGRRVRLNELVRGPLQAMWRLVRGGGTGLIGLLAREGVYTRGMGLKPLGEPKEDP